MTKKVKRKRTCSKDVLGANPPCRHTRHRTVVQPLMICALPVIQGAVTAALVEHGDGEAKRGERRVERKVEKRGEMRGERVNHDM